MKRNYTLPPFMNRAIGFTSLLGFVLAIAVHALTFAHIDVIDRFPYVWWLHGGCLVVVFPLIIALRKRFGPRATFAQLRSTLPRWASLLLVAIAAYAIINFVLFFILSEGASPGVREGQFVLHSHGKIIRVLTEAEYHVHQAYVARGFSGHWLLFYLAPTLFFLFGSRTDTPHLPPKPRDSPIDMTSEK